MRILLFRVLYSGPPQRKLPNDNRMAFQVAKVRESDGSTSVAAGGCLENPSYIDPCIEVGSLGCTIEALIIT